MFDASERKRIYTEGARAIEGSTDTMIKLARLVDKEQAWRKTLGRDAQAGAFLGRQSKWRRISEVWEGEGLTDDAAIEAAERLATYITVLEPLRRKAGS